MPRRKKMSEEEIKAMLKESFDNVDADKDGLINPEELKAALDIAKIRYTDEEFVLLLAACEPDANGNVGFEGFAGGIVEAYVRYRVEMELRKAFVELDVDGSGFITADNIKEVCGMYGEEITEAQVTELITAMDTDGTGKISLPEFTEAAMKVIEEKIKAKYAK